MALSGSYRHPPLPGYLRRHRGWGKVAYGEDGIPVRFAEMATIRAAIKDLAGEAELAEAMGESAADQRAKLDVLKNRLSILRGMPDEPDRIILVQTGLTVVQHWANLNGQGKAAMLQSHRAKVRAEQTDSGLVVKLDPGTLTPANRL
jgi:hypothetical protein